jgi:DNA repair exonuclease SbcCD ATPase subunit
MFKYGENNRIDFDQLNGIAGVVAPNRAGKSSIIDIIVFGLYGEHLRASNKTIVRKGYAKPAEAVVTVYFVVNNTRYKITRRVNGAKSTATLQEYIGDKYVGVSSEDNLVKINKRVHQLTGGADQLLCTSLYYDQSGDILKMKPTERMRTLMDLFGGVNNGDLVSVVKKERDAAANALRSAPVLRDNAAMELSALEAALTDLTATEAELAASLASLDGEIADMPSSATIQTHIAAAARLSDINAQLRIIGVPEYAEPAPPAPKVPPSDYVGPSSRELMAVMNKINIVYVDADIKTKLARAVSNQNTDIISNPPTRPISNLDVLRSESPKMVPANGSLDAADKLVRSLAPAKFTFDDGCSSCKINKGILCQDLINAERALEEAAAAEETRLAHNAEVAAKLTIIAHEEAAHAAWAKYMVALEHDKLIAGLQAQYDLMLSQQADMQRLSELKAQMTLAVTHEAHLAHLASVKWIAWSNYRTLLRDKAELEAIIEYNDTLSHNDIDLIKAKKSMLEANRTQLRAKWADVHASLAMTKDRIFNLRTEMDVAKSYDRTALEAAAVKWGAYYDALSGPKMRTQFVSKNIQIVVSHCNETLRCLSDFTLETDCNETSIDFNIVEKDGAGRIIIIPVNMGSGFQRFIISIAMRLALTKCSPVSADFIMIDEGFGCMDKRNLHNLTDLMSMIADEFKFMFIVSHVPEITASIRTPMTIVDGASGSTIIGAVATAAPGEATAAPASAVLPVSNTTTCGCGKTIKNTSLKAHLRSKSHKDWADSK